MAHNTRSNKRRRTSSTTQTLFIVAPGDPTEPASKGQEVFTRHPDFWLDDGSLVLIAGRTAFRVFRSILVKKSVVFADMFATGSTDATEMFDGCPVVRLPDHPEDLRDFLQYLMPCSPLMIRDSDLSPVHEFPEVHAAIHLAHKYQCPEVEVRALCVLQKRYTSHFAEYDWRYSDLSTLFPPARAAIAVVNIARQMEAPSLLPYALYLLCDLGAPMVEGYARRDGSVEHLSTGDLQLCIAARNTLAWELVRRVERVFSPAAYTGTGSADVPCRTSRTCTAARTRFRDLALPGARGECNALALHREFIEVNALAFRLCKVCTGEMLRRDVEERRRIWMLLPEIFGLGVDECGFTDGRGRDLGGDKSTGGIDWDAYSSSD